MLIYIEFCSSIFSHTSAAASGSLFSWTKDLFDLTFDSNLKVSLSVLS